MNGPAQMLKRPGARIRVILLSDNTYVPVISVPRYYPTLDRVYNTVCYTGACELSQHAAEKQIEAWRAS